MAQDSLRQPPDLQNTSVVQHKLLTGTEVDVEGKSKYALDAFLRGGEISIGEGVAQSNLPAEVSAPRGVLTTIQEYTVPAGKTFTLKFAEVGGDSAATIKIYIDGVRQGTVNISVLGPFQKQIVFAAPKGLTVNEGQVIKTDVLNHSFRGGDFHSRLVGDII